MHPAPSVYRPIRMTTVNCAPRPAPEAEELYRRWLQFLDDEFVRHSSPERRAEIVRDQLYQLYLGRPHGGKLNLTLTSELPGNILGLSLDSANVTLEAEYFCDVDRERYAQRKPLPSHTGLDASSPGDVSSNAYGYCDQRPAPRARSGRTLPSLAPVSRR